MAQSPADLFATSWTLHRLGPLYHGKECATLLDNPAALRLYASRLRDTLTGDVLRGVQLSGTSTSAMLDEVLAKAGALKSCRWDSLPTWSHWNEEQSLLEDPDEDAPVITPDQSAGLMVVLEYENITYRAALLSGPDGYHDSRTQVTHLPLLITRMPNALRQEFTSFLSTNFDSRVSILRLPSNFLCSGLENYLATLNRAAAAAAAATASTAARGYIERVIKETQLTLSFPPPISPALRSLDVSLPRESLGAFYAHSTTTKSTETPSAPFLSALSEYFSTHLSMPLDISALKSTTHANARESPHMRLTKVSCGAFVLGAEGRMKFLANPGRAMFLGDEDHDEGGDEEDVEDREKRLIWRANEGLLRALVKRAAGTDG